MKSIYTILFSFFFISILSVQLEGQDAHFSQFYISPLTLNPALTGMKNGDIRVAANYRRQWSSISAPFQTMSLAADYNLLGGKIGDNLMGVGLVIFNDKAGSAGLRRTKIATSLGYSQNLGIDGTYISVGVEAGITQQKLDPTKLLFENQFDGENLNGQIGSGEELINNSSWNYDLTAGLAWSYAPDSYTSFYLGGAISHLNRPNKSFYDGEPDLLDMKYTFYAGAEFRISGYVSAIPRAVLLKQGSHSELNFGGYIKLNLNEPRSENPFFMSVGGMYRLKDAIIPMVRIDYGPIAIGLSYDINVSSLSVASNAQGGMELSFVYKGNSGGKDISPIPCPTF